MRPPDEGGRWRRSTCPRSRSVVGEGKRIDETPHPVRVTRIGRAAVEFVASAALADDPLGPEADRRLRRRRGDRRELRPRRRSRALGSPRAARHPDPRRVHVPRRVGPRAHRPPARGRDQRGPAPAGRPLRPAVFGRCRRNCSRMAGSDRRGPGSGASAAGVPFRCRRPGRTPMNAWSPVEPARGSDLGRSSLLPLAAVGRRPSRPQRTKAAPVELPEPLTREAIRELVARLSDAEVRELLLAQLDKAAAPDGRPGGRARWLPASRGTSTAPGASSARCSGPRPMCPPRWAPRWPGSPRDAPRTICCSSPPCSPSCWRSAGSPSAWWGGCSPASVAGSTAARATASAWMPAAS